MMETMISTNKVVTNALRITALIVMIVGIVAFFNPIVSILGWIPIVGGFLQGTAGGLIIIGAIIVSVPMFLITFSLAWLVYHPKTGAIFLIAGLLVVAIIVILD